jgi:hypothetical protein
MSRNVTPADSCEAYLAAWDPSTTIAEKELAKRDREPSMWVLDSRSAAPRVPSVPVARGTGRWEGPAPRSPRDSCRTHRTAWAPARRQGRRSQVSRPSPRWPVQRARGGPILRRDQVGGPPSHGHDRTVRVSSGQTRCNRQFDDMRAPRTRVLGSTTGSDPMRHVPTA